MGGAREYASSVLNAWADGGETEVNKHCTNFVFNSCDYDVFKFDVPMGNAVDMKVGDCRDDLLEDWENGLLCERFLLEKRQKIGLRARHHCANYLVRDKCKIHRAYVRMSQAKRLLKKAST